MKQLLKFSGSGVIGNKIKIYFRGPLIKIVLFENKLTIKIWPFWSYEILLEDIESVSVSHKFFYSSIKINHHSNAPSHIEFRHFRSRIDKLYSVLEEKGIRVDNSIETQK